MLVDIHKYLFYNDLIMVLRAGLEPAHLAALPPEDSVSTNSTT